LAWGLDYNLEVVYGFCGSGEAPREGALDYNLEVVYGPPVWRGSRHYNLEVVFGFSVVLERVPGEGEGPGRGFLDYNSEVVYGTLDLERHRITT
jgi:hypothetical protein